jgi:hypothetical protein
VNQEIIKMKNLCIDAEEMIFQLIAQHREGMVITEVEAAEDALQINRLDEGIVIGIFGVIPKDQLILEDRNETDECQGKDSSNIRKQFIERISFCDRFRRGSFARRFLGLLLLLHKISFIKAAKLQNCVYFIIAFSNYFSVANLWNQFVSCHQRLNIIREFIIRNSQFLIGFFFLLLLRLKSRNHKRMTKKHIIFGLLQLLSIYI